MVVENYEQFPRWSNYDTTDLLFAEKVSQGLHFTWLPKFLKDKVAKEVEQIKLSQFGNSFDLGDGRYENFYPISSTLWNIRNTAYNFVYMFEECLPTNIVAFKPDSFL